MRKFSYVVAAACGCLLSGCSSSNSYLVTVSDRASSRVVEGATLEIMRDARQNADVAATTNERGEAVVVMQSDERTFLIVTFDGTVDHYFVRPDLAPAWNASPETPDEPSGAVRFLAGAPSSRPSPTWLVRVVRLH